MTVLPANRSTQEAMEDMAQKIRILVPLNWLVKLIMRGFDRLKKELYGY